MSSTTSKGFPYPLSTDPVDVPSDIYSLANTIDTKSTSTAVANTLVYRETSGKITIGDPTATSHAATKNYTDSQITLAVPFTTKGDIIYAGANGSAVTQAVRLGIGTNGYVLAVSGGVPVWQSPTAGTGSGTGTGYTQTAGTLGSNTAITIDTIAVNTFIGIEYLLNMRQGSKVRASTIKVVTNGSSLVSFEEYGVTEIGGTMSGVNVIASYLSSNSILQVTVTDAATTAVTWRLSRLAQ
jgi:hypothetical protein